MSKIFEWFKNHKIATALLGVVVCVIVIFAFLLGINENYIEFSQKDSQVLEFEYGEEVAIEAPTALYKGTIFNQKGTPISVIQEGNVDDSKVGTYVISYTATHEKAVACIGTIVIIKDTQAPVIELVSNPEHYTSPVGTYEEEGFTAIDNYDGDITASVQREEKDGVVTYTVSDSSGNTTVVTRAIIYKDVIAPVISLKGSQNITLYVGEGFSDAGATATDECDGDISANISVEGSVNTAQSGTYVLVYKVADSSGNVSEARRTVTVKNRVVATGDKVIYLTFDDGPCAYTPRLLEILDKYNVKATFFVTGANASYYNQIGEAYRRGHTIAIHTYSHVYKDIYSSWDAYWADFTKIKDIIVAQTGEEPWLVRFPGGTSNTISRNYCQGIMSTIVNEMNARGYSYCDWNVSSGDAGGATTSQAIYNNVVNGCSRRSSSIVLQHDMNKKSVDAVEDIIRWGLANGYTFKAMDKNTPLVHQNAQN